MLDKLKAADFKKAIDKQGTIVIEDGPDATVTFLTVTENKAAAAPDAKKGTRTPFTVVMRCDHATSAQPTGVHDVLLPDGTRLEGVTINEISAHPKPDDPMDETLTPDTRVFQMVFA
ncbi:MAG: hypothetical protein NXI21_18245 [Alphaproteobacteria bacterium]|nr:hypothetical protein [Alphaproteobacteria bacterium]